MWKEYLDRIGVEREKISIDEISLWELHEKHLLSIPFEDLDIHSNISIILNINSIFDKVVRGNRGGFCYELNYLFCNLLREIGFEAHFISSRIYSDKGILGPEFDHMSIVVTLKDKWLLDVGYGDLFIRPVKIENHSKSKDWFKSYRIDAIEKNKYLLSESLDGKAFSKKYQFSTESKEIEDFEEQCQFKQKSKDSYFVKNLICTLPNPTGRKTVLNNQFIERKNELRTVTEIKGRIEMISILRNSFNIEGELYS